MCPTAAETPPPAELSLGEFDARPWRKDELIALARTLDIPTKGTKADIADRIRITLIRRSIAPAVEVHTGAPSGGSTCTHGGPTAVHRPETQSAVRTAAADFYRARPGESRAQGLAAWFARRSARHNSR